MQLLLPRTFQTCSCIDCNVDIMGFPRLSVEVYILQVSCVAYCAHTLQIA